MAVNPAGLVPEGYEEIESNVPAGYEAVSEAVPEGYEEVPTVGMGDMRAVDVVKPTPAPKPKPAQNTGMDAGMGMAGSRVNPGYKPSFEVHPAFSGYQRQVEADRAKESTAASQELQKWQNAKTLPMEDLRKMLPQMEGMRPEDYQLELDRKIVEAQAKGEKARLRQIAAMDNVRVESAILNGKAKTLPIGQRYLEAEKNAKAISEGTARFVKDKASGKVYLGGLEIPVALIRKQDPAMANVLEGGAVAEADRPRTDLEKALGINPYLVPVGSRTWARKGLWDTGKRVMNPKTGKLEPLHGLASIDPILTKVLGNFAEGATQNIVMAGQMPLYAAGATKAGDLLGKLAISSNIPDEYKTFVDNLINGAGSIAGSYAIGIGTRNLAMMGAPGSKVRRAANWLAAAVAGSQEAAAEGTGSYQSMIEQGKPEGARAAMWKTFWANIPLNIVLDKVGILNSEAGTGLKRVLAAHGAEGTQEALQQVIQNLSTGRPWSEGVAESGAIGAILGGAVKGGEVAYRNRQAAQFHADRSRQNPFGPQGPALPPLPQEVSNATQTRQVPGGDLQQHLGDGTQVQANGNNRQHAPLVPQEGAPDRGSRGNVEGVGVGQEAQAVAPAGAGAVPDLVNEIEAMRALQAQGQDVGEELEMATELLRQMDPKNPVLAVPLAPRLEEAPAPVLAPAETPAQALEAPTAVPEDLVPPGYEAIPEQAIPEELVPEGYEVVPTNPHVGQVNRLVGRLQGKVKSLDEGELNYPEAAGATLVPSERMKGMARGQGQPLLESEPRTLRRVGPPKERRKDQAYRKRVEDMTPAEMRKALLTSEKTGLGNRRAWEEAQKKAPKAVKVSMDVDSLKWVNDNLGHEAGDALLAHMGDALRAAGLGEDAFHTSGDEFLAHGDTTEGMEASLEKVYNYLRDNPIVAIKANGEGVRITGGFSYGTGPDIASAEAGLQAHKAQREQSGERAQRGAEPPGVRPAKSELQGTQNRGQVHPEPKAQAGEEVAPAPKAKPTREELLARMAQKNKGAGTAPAPKPAPTPAPASRPTPRPTEGGKAPAPAAQPKPQASPAKQAQADARANLEAAKAKFKNAVLNAGKGTAMSGVPLTQEVMEAGADLLLALVDMGYTTFKVMAEEMRESLNTPDLRRSFELAYDSYRELDDSIEPRGQDTMDSLFPEEAQPTPAPAEAKAGIVKPADLSIVKNWHAKYRRDNWVVKLNNHVSREAYDALKGLADKHFGKYSSYDKQGAIPGFQFDKEANAKAFLDAATGGQNGGLPGGRGSGAATPAPQGGTGTEPGGAGPADRGNAQSSPAEGGTGNSEGSVPGGGRGTGGGRNTSVRAGTGEGGRGGGELPRGLLRRRNDSGVAEPSTMEGAFSLESGPAREYLENLNLTSEKQKVEAARTHLEIIRLIRRLVAEDRLLGATPEEKSLLAKWVGWGALKDAVDAYLSRNVKMYRERGYPLSSDMESWAKTWERLSDEIIAELTPAELELARASTLNAHYTALPVVEGMWDMIRGFGFEGGSVLEPSIGSGNFIGLMPEAIRQASSVTGAELDSMTAMVVQAIYPEAEIFSGDYQDAPIPDGSVDLVISNVPFSHEIRKEGHSLHNWFFLQGMKHLRPGGMMVAITSLGTMDSTAAKHRALLARDADLVGAIRLPSNAFSKNAGTEVPTDILVFRKKDSVSFPTQSFQGTIQVDLGLDRNGNPQSDGMNEYYAEHPEQILGRFAINTMNGQQEGMTIKWDGTREEFANAFKEALNRLPQGWAQSGVPTNLMDRGIAASTEMLSGTVYRDDDGNAKVFYNGKIYTPSEWVSVRSQVKANEEESLKHPGAPEPPPPTPRKMDPKRAQELDESAKVYLDLKDAARELREAQDSDQTDEQVDALRQKTLDLYNRFRNRNGRERPIGSNVANPHIADDPDRFEVASLEIGKDETVKEPGGVTHIVKRYVPADILQRRIGKPRPVVDKAENIAEAVTLSLLEHGRIVPEKIGSLLGITPDAARAQALAESVAFVDPKTRGLIPAWQYLSGNIREKIEDAKAAAEKDPFFQRNVEKLNEVRPALKPITQISAKMGADWIPMEVFSAFASEALGLSVPLEYEKITGTYKVDTYRTRVTDPALASKWSVQLDKEPGMASAAEVFESALTWNEIEVTYEIDGSRRVNKLLTSMARDKVNALRSTFNEWLRQEGNPHVEELERLYNDRFNVLVHPKMPHMPVTGFPGQATIFNGKPFHMESYQVEGTFAGLLGNTLLAHVVGSGKTITGATISMELRRLGLADRVTIATTRSVAQQFAAQVRQLYPSARILVRPSTGGAVARKTFLNRMATMDYDMVILTHEDLTAIPDNPIRVEAFVREERAKIEEVTRGLARETRGQLSPRDPRVKALRDRGEWLDDMLDQAQDDEAKEKNPAKGKKGARAKAKQAEKAKVARGRTLEQLLKRKTDRVLTWDDLRMDGLIVDESHVFKRLDFWTQFNQLKGIDNDSSKRAMSAYLKTKAIHERNGRIIFMTGTPITNTMAEIWTNVRYLRPDLLAGMGISEFDAFVKTFGEISTKPEMSATGVFKSVQRLRRFVNVPELRQMLGQVMHRVTADQIKREKLPVMAGGGPKMEIAKPSRKAEEMTAYIRSVLGSWDLAGKMKMLTRYIPVVCYTRAAQAAIDPRLLDPTLPPPEQGKLLTLADNLAKHYRETQEDLGAQVVFVEHYQSPKAYGPGSAFIMPEEDRFNMLKELKRLLVERGIPADEIVEKLPDGDEARAKIFEAVNSGKVRVICGGTMSLGVGVNIQERLVAAHHLELATTPANQDQRNGRIIRAGNIYDTAHVYVYATEGSADAFFAQMLDTKKRFADQIMDMDAPIENEFDDPGDISMTYEEMSAAITGDQRIAQKIGLQNQLNLLESERDAFAAAKRKARWDLENLTADATRSGSVAFQENRVRVLDSITEKIRKDIQDLILHAVENRMILKEKDTEGKVHESLNTGRVKLPEGMEFIITDTKGGLGGLGASWALTKEGVHVQGGNATTPSGLKASLSRHIPEIETIQTWAHEALERYRADLRKAETMMGKEYGGQERLEATKTKLEELVKSIDAGINTSLRDRIRDRMAALEEAEQAESLTRIEGIMARADEAKAKEDREGELEALQSAENEAYLAMVAADLTQEKRFSGTDVKDYEEWFPYMMSEEWWDRYGDKYREAVDAYREAKAASKNDHEDEMGFYRPEIAGTIALSGLASTLVAGLTGSALAVAATAVGLPLAVAVGYMVYRHSGRPAYLKFIQQAKVELGPERFKEEAPRLKEAWSIARDLAQQEDREIVDQALQDILGSIVKDPGQIERKNPSDLGWIQEQIWKPWRIGTVHPEFRPITDIAERISSRAEAIKHDFIDFLDNLKALPPNRREAVTRAWNTGTREEWEEEVEYLDDETGDVETRIVNHLGRVYTDRELIEMFGLTGREINLYRDGLEAGKKLADLQIQEHSRRMDRLIQKLLKMLANHQDITGLNIEEVRRKIKSLEAAHTRALRVGDTVVADDLHLQIWALQQSAAEGLSLRKWVYRQIKAMKLAHVRLVDTLTRNEAYAPLHRMGDQEAVVLDAEHDRVLYIMAPTRWRNSLKRMLQGHFEKPGEASINLAIKAAAREYHVELRENGIVKGTKYRMDPKLMSLSSPLDPSRLANLIDSVTADPSLLGIMGEEESKSLAEMLRASAETSRVKDFMKENKLRHHLLERKGTYGESMDGLAAWSSYVQAAAQSIAANENMEDLQGAIEAIPKGSKPKLRAYAEHLKAQIIAPVQVNPLVENAIAVTALWTIGGKISFAIQNASQFMVEYQRLVNRFGHARALSASIKAQILAARLQTMIGLQKLGVALNIQALADIDPFDQIQDAKLRKITEDAFTSGIFMDRVGDRLLRYSRGQAGGKVSLAYRSAKTLLMSPASLSEQNNRVRAFLGYAMAQPDEAINHGQLMADAVDHVRHVHFERAGYNKSKLERSLGGIGSMLTMFQYFLHEFIQETGNAFRVAYMGEKDAYKHGTAVTALQMVGGLASPGTKAWAATKGLRSMSMMMFALAGVSGFKLLLGLYDVAKDLLDRISQWLFGTPYDPTKDVDVMNDLSRKVYDIAIKNGMNPAEARQIHDIVMHGASNAVGVDMSGSISPGFYLLPDTTANPRVRGADYIVTLGGVPGAVYARLVDAWLAWEKGEKEKSVRMAMPAFMKHWTDAATGTAPLGGRNIPLSPVERVIKATAFTPTKLAREYWVKDMTQERLAALNTVKADLGMALVRAMRTRAMAETQEEKDEAMVRAMEARREISEHNKRMQKLAEEGHPEARQFQVIPREFLTQALREMRVQKNPERGVPIRSRRELKETRERVIGEEGE